MRPLVHPPVSELTVEGILYALADPVRACIFRRLLEADCARDCSTFTNVSDAPLPKSSLSQHFKILREAGLIRSERKGVELRNRTRCAELDEKFGPMIRAILAGYEAQGVGVKS